MQPYVRRGLAVACTMVSLGACADSLGPTEPRATRTSPASSPVSISASVGDSTVICKPCPPGVVCAAVCDPALPIEVAGDTAGTNATVVFGPALEFRTAISPGH